MLKTKFMAGALLIAAILFAQVGVAMAAPVWQESTLTGTIQSITPETDVNGVTTILVTLLDSQGATQTFRLSVDEAVALGLVTLDAVTGAPVVDTTKIGQTVVIPGEPVEEDETIHPVADLLASFFDVDPGVVNGYHEDGFGFGVIAQALWMSKNLNGDASLAGLILEAKKTGDYSAFTLPDGSTPTNWGQFKKAVSDKKNNLGIVVSGKGNNGNTDPENGQEHGNGNDKEKNNDKGNGKNKP